MFIEEYSTFHIGDTLWKALCKVLENDRGIVMEAFCKKHVEALLGLNAFQWIFDVFENSKPARQFLIFPIHQASFD